jgi:hypothetical protein
VESTATATVLKTDPHQAHRTCGTEKESHTLPFKQTCRPISDEFETRPTELENGRYFSRMMIQRKDTL